MIMLFSMPAMPWSCYISRWPWHDLTMIIPWRSESLWSYHVIAWSSCLTMAVIPGMPKFSSASPLWCFNCLSRKNNHNSRREKNWQSQTTKKSFSALFVVQRRSLTYWASQFQIFFTFNVALRDTRKKKQIFRENETKMKRMQKKEEYNKGTKKSKQKQQNESGQKKRYNFNFY